MYVIAHMIWNKGCNSMNKIDLHIHSVYSDGSNTVEEIVREAQRKQLSCFSICDHDTFKAYEELNVIPSSLLLGIEVSAYDYKNHKEVHILGYGFKSTKHVKKLCDDTLEMLTSIAFQQVQKIKEEGFDIAWEDVIAKAKCSTSVYKQHIMSVLVDKGYCTKISGELYRKLFKNGGICQLEKNYPDVRDVVEAIHKDYGYAIVAHPGIGQVYNHLSEYLKYGIDGIETYHSSHGEWMVKLLHEFATHYKLCETGGSDYHGDYGKQMEIGECNVEMVESNVELCIKEFLKSRK